MCPEGCRTGSEVDAQEQFPLLPRGLLPADNGAVLRGPPVIDTQVFFLSFCFIWSRVYSFFSLLIST